MRRLLTRHCTRFCLSFYSSFYQIAKRVICRRNNPNPASNFVDRSYHSNTSSPRQMLRRNNSFQLDDQSRFMTRTRLRPGGPSSGSRHPGAAAAATVRGPAYHSADPQVPIRKAQVCRIFAQKAPPTKAFALWARMSAVKTGKRAHLSKKIVNVEIFAKERCTKIFFLLTF